MPSTIPAAAEGLPLTRRLFMRHSVAAGTVAATAGLPAIAAAADEPVDAAEPFHDHPWVRARKLADELADVLAEDCDTGGGGPAGDWYATIQPRMGDERYCVMFGSISARDDMRRTVSLPLQKLIADHKSARAAFRGCCRDTDEVALGREPSKAAWRRWKRAGRTEEKALTAVCAYSPFGRADAAAKVAYLKDLDGLSDDQFLALLYSTVPL